MKLKNNIQRNRFHSLSKNQTFSLNKSASQSHLVIRTHDPLKIILTICAIPRHFIQQQLSSINQTWMTARLVDSSSPSSSEVISRKNISSLTLENPSSNNNKKTHHNKVMLSTRCAPLTHSRILGVRRARSCLVSADSSPPPASSFGFLC